MAAFKVWTEFFETLLNKFRVSVVQLRTAYHIHRIKMGSEVLPRRKFIQTRAKQVQNLDI